MIMTERQHACAKDKGWKWIWVNSSNHVMGSVDKPQLVTKEKVFGSIITWEPEGELIGGYQGNLWWTGTLEEVK